MNIKKINLKKENGATGLDIATGALVFILFTTVILTLYVQIYKQSALIKIHQDAMTYVIKICEDIDLKEYGEIEDLNDYKNSIISQIGLPEDRYTLSLSQEKYIDTYPDAKDIVKKIKISLVYNFAGQDKEIIVNKIKVKE